ncbi:MAG: flippase [Christensenellaceae bacterium]|nr:flippase [Christensenellaceae bacterium]
MKQRNNLKKNVALQIIYEILGTCIPLITSPYLSRVLGAEQVGVFSYTSSIVAYFLLFSKLGTISHGIRSIASVGDDQDKRNEEFWGIYGFQSITTCFCIILYAVYLFFICAENQKIAAIQIIELFANLICVNWLFAGLERFNLTVKVSIIIRLLSVACILLFVKKPADLWIYAFIMVISAFLTQLLLWFSIKKEITAFKVSLKKIVSNLKPSLMLFIPLLAMSVYHIMDKTMLGAMSNYYQSGYYYNADKIVNISVGVISGVSTVMLPRMSSLIGNGKANEADLLFKVSLEGTVVAGVAIAFGIAAIAKEFIPVFFGAGYEECIPLTIALSPVLIIKSFSFTSRYQYLIPHKNEKAFICSVIAGAAVNLIVNILLIPQYGAMGAVIGTIVAELTACVWQYIAISRYINLKKTLTRTALYFIVGLLMFAGVRVVSRINVIIYGKIIVEIIAGAVIYMCICLAYWKTTGNPILNVLIKNIKERKKIL